MENRAFESIKTGHIRMQSLNENSLMITYTVTWQHFLYHINIIVSITLHYVSRASQ